MIRIHFNLRWNRKLAVRSMNVEYPVDRHHRAALIRDGAIDAGWTEGYLRITTALEYVVVHFAIAHPVARPSACCVYHDLAGNLMGSCIKLQRALLHLKGTVHGMQGGIECEFDGGFGRIELQSRLLR